MQTGKIVPRRLRISQRLQSTLAGLMFFVSMTFSYLLIVSHLFAYMGFKNDFSPSRGFFSMIIIVVLGFFVARVNDVASFFRLAAFLTYICPALVLYTAAGVSQRYLNAAMLGFLVLCVASSMPIRTTVVLRVSARTILLVCFSASISICIAIAFFGGLSYFSLDFGSVYDFRDLAADALPGFFAYVISPVSKVILPFGIILAVQKRSVFFVVLFIFIGIVLYGLTHHKSIVVIPFVTLVLYFGLRQYGILRGLIRLIIFISVVTALEVLYLRTLSPESLGPISSFLVRRVFLVPPLLDSFYVDYFSENPLFYWASSRITFGLVDTDYSLTAPFLVGLQFFDSDEMSANTGFIGSGFSNAGIVGVALYGFLIGIVIAALNALGRRIDPVTVICVSFSVVTTALTTSDLVTVFLTHGLLLLFAVLTLMPRYEARS